jgi:FtsH-binding integral membrane protein
VSNTIRNAVLIAATLAVLAIIASRIGDAPYPVKGVMIFAALVALEATTLFLILRPRTYRRSWGRAAVAVAACLVALWFSAQDTEGAPEYVFMHQKWLAAASLACLALAVSGVVSIIRHRLAA